MQSTLMMVHTASTLALVGLIWVVQLAIYPLFRQVGTEAFPSYHRSYTGRIGLVVAPLMCLELISAGCLLATYQGPIPRFQWIAGMAAVIAIWLITGLLSVPAHRRLTQGFDAQAARSLVLSNWIRTLLWTTRGAWVCSLLYELSWP